MREGRSSAVVKPQRLKLPTVKQEKSVPQADMLPFSFCEDPVIGMKPKGRKNDKGSGKRHQNLMKNIEISPEDLEKLKSIGACFSFFRTNGKCTKNHAGTEREFKHILPADLDAAVAEKMREKEAKATARSIAEHQRREEERQAKEQREKENKANENQNQAPDSEEEEFE